MLLEGGGWSGEQVNWGKGERGTLGRGRVVFSRSPVLRSWSRRHGLRCASQTVHDYVALWARCACLCAFLPKSSPVLVWKQEVLHNTILLYTVLRLTLTASSVHIVQDDFLRDKWLVQGEIQPYVITRTNLVLIQPTREPPLKIYFLKWS